MPICPTDKPSPIPSWDEIEERGSWQIDVYLCRELIKEVWRNGLNLGEVIQAGLNAMGGKK